MFINLSLCFSTCQIRHISIPKKKSSPYSRLQLSTLTRCQSVLNSRDGEKRQPPRSNLSRVQGYIPVSTWIRFDFNKLCSHGQITKIKDKRWSDYKPPPSIHDPASEYLITDNSQLKPHKWVIGYQNIIPNNHGNSLIDGLEKKPINTTCFAGRTRTIATHTDNIDPIRNIPEFMFRVFRVNKCAEIV